MGVKIEKIKNPRYPACKALNFMSFGAYGLCSTSNLHILAACKHLSLFGPKSRNMTSLKCHFLKKLSTDFSEILLEDVKLMPNKVLKVSRRYLLSFLSYRENTGGGGGNIYPPALPGLSIHKSNFKNISIFDSFIALYGEKGVTQFFDLHFFGFYTL